VSRPPILRALQGGLEAMYRVTTELDVGDFLVDDDARRQVTTRAPDEQLLVHEHDGEVSLGLFVDGRALDHLARRDPRVQLDDENLGDFLLALEGVSHFVYLAHRARASRPVSAVELELQAEIDKWLVALLVTWDQNGAPPADLRERLFDRVHFVSDLTPEERSRYALANNAANVYSAHLERRFVRRGAVPDMLAELRRFYQQDLGGKLDRIARAA
jgi:hypothetical protein